MPSLLTCKVSAEKSANSLMVVPLYMTIYFSLAAFRILSLTSAVLIMLCLGVSLLGFFLLGTLCDSCIRVSVSLFRFVKFLAIISLNRFLILFFVVWTTHSVVWMLALFMLYHRSCMLLCFRFHLSFCLLFWLGDFHYSVFQVTHTFFCVI